MPEDQQREAQPEPGQSEGMISERTIASYTKSLSRWTMGLVGVSAITAGILLVHAHIFHETDETARAANRAYVFLQDLSFTAVKVDGKLAWAVTPQWANGGNTTTKDMNMHVGFWGADDSDPRPYGYSRCATDAKAVPFVLGPKQISAVGLAQFDPDVFEAIQSRNAKQFKSWGWARYTDQFSDKPRITRFCFDIKHVTGNPRDENATLKMLYGLCTEGNCTDDQCKAEDEKMASTKAKADQYCADLNKQFPQSEK